MLLQSRGNLDEVAHEKGGRRLSVNMRGEMLLMSGLQKASIGREPSLFHPIFSLCILSPHPFKMYFSALLLPLLPLVAGQLSGTVGPTTTTSAKAAKKICNILDYGGTASATTDNSAAIASAWAACKSGGEVYIPSGSYGLENWVTLNGGSGVSINLEGTIYRTGTAGGNMIFVEHTTDFEFYSANSAGAVQGYGYQFHEDGKYGPRILRLYKVTDFSVHDIALVDSPAFHLTLDTCTNGEIYNMIVRGGNKGGLDGVDVWGTNIWVHDVEVTSKIPNHIKIQNKKA